MKTSASSKETAIKAAEIAVAEYCREKNFQVSVLGDLSVYYLGEIVLYAQEVEGHGKGLLEDLDTLPRPVLIYNIKTGTIEEGEYADSVLKRAS